jgi:hypothetical protein
VPCRARHSGSDVHDWGQSVTPARSVTVMDQISRLAVPRRGFDQLPPDPSGARMGGDFEVDELTTPMADEEE